MVNAFCVLFADNYRNDDLQGLVRNRTLASLSIASRYRMIDFMLSSLVKAEVSNIAVVTNHHYKSLMDHLSWGKDWDLNRKNSGLKFITPMSNHLSNRVAHNKIEALDDAISYSDGLLEEYCILADANIVNHKLYLMKNIECMIVYITIMDMMKFVQHKLKFILCQNLCLKILFKKEQH